VAYLDAGTTQKMNAAGRDALLAALDDGWADPARLHREGRRAQLMINEAMASMASILGVRSDELHALGSGTQAVHAGIEGLAWGRRRIGGPCVLSAVEHSSVMTAATAVTSAAEEAPHVVPVDREGVIDRDALDSALSGGPVRVVAVQSVNQETGTKQPLETVAELCRRTNVPLLIDAAQSVGREELIAHGDVITASAHKWGGPAGVGLVAIRTGVRWRAATPTRALDRTGQGFPDVPALMAASASLEQAERERSAAHPLLMQLTERIRTAAAAIPDVEVVGHPTQRAAHLVTFSCLYVAGEAIVDALDRKEFSAASGSACASEALGPSHVLAAMGVLTHGNVRIGLPADVDPRDVDRFIETLPVTIAKIRADAGVDRL